MKYNKLIIDNSQNNDTIYTYLKRNGFSENYVRNLRKQEGYILLNSQSAHTDFKIKNGDMLEICKNPNTTTSIMQCRIPLDIVYEDDDLLIVNKPSGLATSASRSHYAENLSGAILNYMLKKDANFVVRIINRLDKDTAGLVMVAKHSLISRLLNESEQIDKTYYAICTGIMEKSLTINAKIETTKNDLGYNNHKRIISNNGKEAITHLQPIKQLSNYTLCKVNIEFGRTHQIRVHCAHIRHPLLGDKLYGEKSDLITHTALVCKEIKFYHPLKKETILAECEFPKDFQNLIV